jgi:replicative superfamily II helicase
MPHVSKLQETQNLIPTNTPVLPHQSALLRYPFTHFNPVQSAAYPYSTSDVNIIVACATSAGKAQPMDSRILTPNGFVLMKDVRVGDKVIASDGSHTVVVGVYPQGKKDVYEVRFSDMTRTECCDDHLWNVQTRSDRCKKKPFKTMTCKDIMSSLKGNDGQNKWFVPVVGPVQYEQRQELPIDPYLLGVLIGDGGIKHSIIFSNIDEHVINRVREIVKIYRLYLKPLGGCDYGICVSDGRRFKKLANGDYAKTNVLRYKLDAIGLFGLGSKEKFIPDMYLKASIDNRIELLRGLMDTDGCIPDNKENGKRKRCSAVFNTSSFRLAEDVLELARSLGGVCSISEKNSNFYTYKGIRRNGSKSYRITINIGDINPFSCPSKSSRFVANDKKTSKKSIEGISFVGAKECQCIKVSREDQLYITDDFIVTHNTVIAESFMADTIWRGGSAMYMAPLRAVVSEKHDDWTKKDYGFGAYAKSKQLNVSILTGDYRLTKERQDELYAAHIIAITPEMLDSRTRRMQMEMNAWLNRVGVLVVDEIHLLGLEDRGHRLESALMRFSSMNKCRIVGLSATMPNVDEVGSWLSALNGKPTLVLDSQWRPVKLVKKIIKVQIGSQSPEVKNRDLVKAAMSYFNEHRDDKTIFFVHTKKIGKLMTDELRRNSFEAAFHSGSAMLGERQTIEMAFRHDPNFKTLVSTSTLAYGMNMPARRVIILGVRRGNELVHPYDIAQMQGRSGRFGLDKEGEAVLLLLSDNFESDLEKYSSDALPPIQSYLRSSGRVEDDATLAFHAVSEVVEQPKRADQLLDWYNRSFAKATGLDIERHEMISFCKRLTDIGIFLNVNEYYQATSLGKIASWMYLSPFDIVDMAKNWHTVFKAGMENDPAAIAFALFNTHTHRSERQYVGVPYDMMGQWQRDLRTKFSNMGLGSNLEPTPIMCIYEKVLSGQNNEIPGEAMHMITMHRQDMDRVLTACELTDSMYGHWGKKLYWRMMSSRVTMGVTARQAELCMVKGIGAALSKQLLDHGVSSIRDLVDPMYDQIVKHILKGKFDSALKDALEIARELTNANNP